MLFHKKEGLLDITDCEFKTSDEIAKAIKGSVKGIKKVRMTKEQMKLSDDSSSYEKVEETTEEKDTRIKVKEQRDKRNNRHDVLG